MEGGREDLASGGAGGGEAGGDGWADGSPRVILRHFRKDAQRGAIPGCFSRLAEGGYCALSTRRAAWRDQK